MYVKARVVHRTMLVAFSKYPVLRLINAHVICLAVLLTFSKPPMYKVAAINFSKAPGYAPIFSKYP